MRIFKNLTTIINNLYEAIQLLKEYHKLLEHCITLRDDLLEDIQEEPNLLPEEYTHTYDPNITYTITDYTGMPIYHIRNISLRNNPNE